jgi:hypothetical protein
MAKNLKIMKKMLMIFTIASVFTACHSKSDLDTNKVMPADSIGVNTGSAPSDTAAIVQKGTGPMAISKSNSSEKTSTSTSNSGSNAASTANETTTTTTAKKQGWSSRAKGAVIGGVAGAVGGAIISKHKGTGAAVGGIVGAAGGYIIGNEKDKKNNR